MRRFVTLALALALAALPTAALAFDPNPNDTVIGVGGRRLVAYSHYGNPDLGQVQCSAQGETVDTNGNGLADALRGRSACLEVRGVTRIVLYYTLLQVQLDGQWFDVPEVGATADRFSTGEPAYVRDYTLTTRFCPNNQTHRTYRVVNAEGIRWSSDNVLGTRRTVSGTLDVRMLVSDPDCIT
jgi:hypothetical protein